MYIADTGFVVSVAISSQPRHEICAALYTATRSTIYLPQIILAETAYMLDKLGRKDAVIHFMRRLPASKYRVEALTTVDIQRATDILEKYQDTRLDFIDASVAAMAERFQVETILTIDRRDFSAIRPAHRPYFELLPG